MPSYSYTVSGHFSGDPGNIDAGDLHGEITDSSIGSNFTFIKIDGDDIDVEFSVALSTPEQTTLDGLIAAHVPGQYGGSTPEETAAEIYGSFYVQDESTTNTTHTNESWVTKLTLDADDCPAGEYRIGWYYEWNCDSTSRDFVGRVILNDSDTLGEHQQEPKESGGSSIGSSGTDQRHVVSGFCYRTLTAGDHEIDVQFRTQDDDVEVSMFRTRLELLRVS